MVGTGHYENFPVASVLLPPAMRRHIAAVYAFARTADDFADEGSLAPQDRLALLDGWEARLHDAQAGRAQEAARTGEPADAPTLFVQLGATIHEKRLPVDLFAALLSAFRQDVTVHRYATWAQLLDYCSRSANPVGRIVLRIAGYDDPARDRLSDAICTALQLTNFWQDLRIDRQRGRVYVPEEDIRARGADVYALDGERLTVAWRVVLQALVARTRSLFELGRPLCDAVPGRLRYELRATWLGGVRILDQIATGRADVLARRPVIGAGDLPWFAGRMMVWSLGSKR
jgi:squalene synthase HpnC